MKLRFHTILFIILFLFITSLVSVSKILAISDPTSVPNNKYGIHVIDENDLNDAAFLVNSSGGDWGYVTIVIPENERKVDKWNDAFLKMKELHLIPIVRLATHSQGDTWARPTLESALDWTEFLNSLNWPTENRYIVLFNEPNHAAEWGGAVDAYNYAKIVVTFAQSLKSSSDKYFVMMAGLDLSAPNGYSTLDEAYFLSAMLNAQPTVFEQIDGWASHAYPNPAFSGKVSDTGRKSLRGYDWELTYLKSLGIQKNLPVFITETGWAHDEEDTKSPRFSPDQIADMITDAANTVWNDSRIIAITPFVLNYQSHPFSQFSWRRLNSGYFYPFFDSYRSLPKIAGNPQRKVDPIKKSSFTIADIQSVQAAETYKSSFEKPTNFIESIIYKVSKFFRTI